MLFDKPERIEGIILSESFRQHRDAHHVVAISPSILLTNTSICQMYGDEKTKNYKYNR